MNMIGNMICSDIDGTFSAGGYTVVVKTEVIKYFTDNPSDERDFLR